MRENIGIGNKEKKVHMHSGIQNNFISFTFSYFNGQITKI